jgi:hypothetical protein
MELVGLPRGIGPSERSHHAAGLDELLENMSAILAMAMLRKTGCFPALHHASDQLTSVVNAETTGRDPMAVALRLEQRFIQQMLSIWDSHTRREPEDACTYIRVTQHEYVLGIASRELLDAVLNEDDGAIERWIGAGERVTGVWHGQI